MQLSPQQRANANANRAEANEHRRQHGHSRPAVDWDDAIARLRDILDNTDDQQGRR